MATTSRLESAIKGFIVGTQFGDAFGIAYEMKTYEQLEGIRKGWLNAAFGNDNGDSSLVVGEGSDASLTRDGLGIYEPAVVVGHPLLSEGFPHKAWTDDTQLSLGMMRSLATYLDAIGVPASTPQQNVHELGTRTVAQLKADQFWSSIAREHVAEYRRTLDGWGGTKHAVARLIDAVEYWDAQQDETRSEVHAPFLAHETSGNATATGNGVLMKLTPLAIHLAVEKIGAELVKANRSTSFACRLRLFDSLCLMTHGSAEARATTIVHGEMLVAFASACLEPRSSDSRLSAVLRKSFAAGRAAAHTALGLLDATEEAIRWPSGGDDGSEVRAALTAEFKGILGDLQAIEQLMVVVGRERSSFAGAGGLASWDNEERQSLEEDLVRISNGGTFFCRNTVTFVWGYLALFAGNTRPSEDVASFIAHSALLGGDTDSNAAVIGGLLGLFAGAAGHSLPPSLPIHEPEELLHTAEEFSHAVARSQPGLGCCQQVQSSGIRRIAFVAGLASVVAAAVWLVSRRQSKKQA